MCLLILTLVHVCLLQLNASIDYALQHNTWCVSFRNSDGDFVDLVIKAMLTVWVHYSCTMPGRPIPESNACQAVLKYFMTNEVGFKKAYQNRMYYFSSGSIFKSIAPKIEDWIARQDDTDEDDDEEVRRYYVEVHMCT